jgi:hypothetical protein
LEFQIKLDQAGCVVHPENVERQRIVMVIRKCS